MITEILSIYQELFDFARACVQWNHLWLFIEVQKYLYSECSGVFRPYSEKENERRATKIACQSTQQYNTDIIIR